MNNDPMAGPVQGLIPGVPQPPSFANQRVNDHDRIVYNEENPFKIKRDKSQKGAKVIKNNVITRFAYSTREGFSVHNVNKKNQDNFILAPNICQTYHQHFFAVCDGHGQNGRQSSMLIKMKFADFLQEFLHQGKEQAKVNSEPDPEEKGEDYQEMLQAQEEKIIADALYNAVIKCQYHIESNAVFNVQLSGTTFTSGFFSGNQLITCNVGDSRVILVSLDGEGKVKAKPLTVDHKPENHKEKARILATGGKVAQA